MRSESVLILPGSHLGEMKTVHINTHKWASQVTWDRFLLMRIACTFDQIQFQNGYDESLKSSYSQSFKQTPEAPFSYSSCDDLRDLVPFMQFKKSEKHNWNF